MKILIEIILLVALNLFLFFYIQRRMILLIAVQHQQLAIYKRTKKRPRIKERDRVFWMALSKIWISWKSHLVIVKPETVIRWHRRKFKDYWRKLSRSKKSLGRPPITKEHIAFIKHISAEHPDFSGKRITGMLKELFGVEHAPSTANKYRVKNKKPPRGTQQWSTFLKNHASSIWSFDFCIQLTFYFSRIYILVIMELENRRIVYITATMHPTLDWLKQQIRYATWDEYPRFLIHDNDGIFGQLGKSISAKLNGRSVSCRSSLDVWLANVMQIQGIPTPYFAPNANAYCERLIGTLRRECLDHVLVFNLQQLNRLLKQYKDFYNHERYHQGIKRIPDPAVDISESQKRKGKGKLVSKPILNGLHHSYRLVA